MKTLRIWFACSLALAVTMLFDWPYGFFAILLPMFILGKSDQLNMPMVIIALVSAIWTTLQATLIVQSLQQHPLLLTAAVGLMMMAKCIEMMHPKTFLFGFMGLLVGSISLNYASYDFINIEEFNVNLWVIALVNIGICSLAWWLFPTSDSQQAPAMPPKNSELHTITQVATGWLVVMLAFVVFQFSDLYDSVSAQVSIIIVLVPMTLSGSWALAKIRIIGTGIGCLAGLAVQVGLGPWFSHGLLFWLAMTLAMGLFCHWQTKGPVKGGIAFSAMSALTVPLTTTLVPQQQDAFFAILYRFSSIFFTVVLTVIAIWIIDHGLKWWFRHHQPSTA
ncbi:DUF2955 domain-containing protein [Ferrimonas aestuarii]|uniref:DUF2955 domain-containing protein n=1 Tax=Ferrimonas aestuarii TaxID=2569539 RepID=A0A4V6WMR5_9GAMM|nr:DUF2955 domain-containing protein [Ferrimonas aestuarii]TKB52728.1 DUF2955 domain-containing protein [Ferrimonas aestuarii]